MKNLKIMLNNQINFVEKMLTPQNSKVNSKSTSGGV